MNPVLLDTGPIVALLDSSERYHQQCVEIVSSLGSPLVTCEAVIAEATYLLRDLRGAAAAVLDNVELGNFLVPYRLTGRAAKLARLIKKYAIYPWILSIRVSWIWPVSLAQDEFLPLMTIFGCIAGAAIDHLSLYCRTLSNELLSSIGSIR